MATWSQHKDIKLIYTQQIYSGKIPKGSFDATVFAINDKWPFLLDIATISSFPFSRSNLGGTFTPVNICGDIQSFQHFQSLFSLGNALDRVVYYKRDFTNFGNAVTTCGDQGRQGGGCKRRAHGIALLVEVDAPVPATPCLSRGKHTTFTTHLHLCG